MTGTFLVVPVSCTNRCLFCAGRFLRWAHLHFGGYSIGGCLHLVVVFVSSSWPFLLHLAGRFHFTWLVVLLYIPTDTA
jgi:hypothetical protein